MRIDLRVLLAALVAIFFAGTAHAASVTGVSLDDQSGGLWGDGINPEPDCVSVVPFCPTGQYFDDNSAVIAPNGWSGWNSSGDQAGTVTGGGAGFTSSHTYYLATQAQNAINTNLYYDGTVEYSVDVSAGAGETWELTIDVGNAGVVTHTDANAGFVEIADSTSFASLTTLSRTNEASTGSAFFDTNNAIGSTTNFNDNGGSWNQAGAFVITGTGSQTVSFDLMFEIDTDIAGMLSFGSGDSMCFNGGLGGSPNTDCNVGGGTGLGVSGTLVTISVPEPATAALFTVGILGLVAAGRRR